MEFSEYDSLRFYQRKGKRLMCSSKQDIQFLFQILVYINIQQDV